MNTCRTPRPARPPLPIPQAPSWREWSHGRRGRRDTQRFAALLCSRVLRPSLGGSRRRPSGRRAMESSAEAGADSLRERLLCETVAGRAGLEYAFELCGLDFLRALDRADLLNVGRLDVLSDVTLDELEAVFRERGGAGSGGCRPGSGAFSRGAGGCLWRGRVRRPAAVRAGHAGGVRLPPGEADGRLWNVLKVRIPRRTRLLLPATDALCPKIKQAK